MNPGVTALAVVEDGAAWGADWTRDGIIHNGTRLAELGFGIVRVYHPLDATTCSCEAGAGCGRNTGKHPIGDDWQRRAEHDPPRVATMLGNPGNRSYGIVAPAGVFGWDVDGDAPDRLRGLAATLGPLPPTRVHRSGAGYHVFYRWPAALAGGSGNLFGIVTRWAPGGMVLGPGSIHAATGRLYAVERDVEVVALPETWARAAASWTSEHNGRQDRAEPGDPDWKIGPDHRHPYLVRSVARLRATGLRREALYDALASLNAERCDPPKPDREIRELAGYYDGKDDDGGGIFLVGEAEVADGGLAGMDAADLMDMNLPELSQAFVGLLPEGLGVMGAPPKAGKSLLAYQMAVALRLGTDLLGCKGGKRAVRYYALEDGKRRSQARIRALLGGRRMPRGLDLRWTAPRLGGPLEDEIAAYLDEHSQGVVIVDVLGKVRPNGKSGLNAYDEDYSLLTALHNVARRHPGSVILLITHDRKAGSEDWLTRITGTRGVTGAADFVIFVNRKRDEMIGTIFVTGRDIADNGIAVEFTGDGWQPADIRLVIGTKSPTRQTIYAWLEEHGPAWQKDIAAGTGLEIGTVHARVHDMARDEEIVGSPDGYRVAT